MVEGKKTILIAGSRSITNKDAVKKAIDEAVAGFGDEDVVFISGGARGVDSIAKEYALEHGKPIVEIKPNWNKHGKAAGMIRNKHMVDKADKAIILWDGESRGTKNTIELVKKKGIAFALQFKADIE